MGDKKRKRDDKASGSAEQNPKRIKNKEPKRNKVRKQTGKNGGIGQGANAIPVKARKEVPAEDGAEGAFTLDATPMEAAEVKERMTNKTKKSKDDEETRLEKKAKKKEKELKKEKEKKKRRKEMKEDKQDKQDEEENEDEEEKEAEKAAKPSKKQAQDQEEQPTESGKNTRFIVFVGNLPYTANAESVTTHFAKISPSSVRVATSKEKPTECRGFGFIEFEQFDRMQTCLKLYHHSSFDDGKSPARKINVELTAGGGGKSTTRKNKIKEKNAKLAEERTKLAKEKKKPNQIKDNASEEQQYRGIHPSRLKQMNGAN